MSADLYEKGGSSHGRWRDDFERVAAQLERYSWTDDEGLSWLHANAPAPLVDLHTGLTSVGYAHGWLPFGDEGDAA